MTPPISIDNTDITGATIDGTDVTEITVDGDVVFSAEAIIEDFETGNLNSYTITDSGFAASTNNPFEGSFCIETGGTSSIITSNPPSGIVPSFGTDFEWYTRGGLSSNSALQFESSGALSEFGFYDGYTIILDFAGDDLRYNRAISGDLDGGGGSVTSNNLNLVSQRWYNIQVTFSGTDITMEVIDTTNNNSLGSITGSQYNSPGNDLAFVKTRSADTIAIDLVQEI